MTIEACPAAEVLDTANNLLFIAPPEQIVPLRDLANSVARARRQFLGNPPAETRFRTITIRFQAPSPSDSAATPAAASLQVDLAPGTPWLTAVNSLARALITREFAQVSPTGDVSPESRSSLDWFAAALTYAVVYTNPDGSGRSLPDYEPVRRKRQTGNLPPPEYLLENPVHPHWRLAFLLYGAHCHLLADILQQVQADSHATALHAFLTLTSSGTPPAKAFVKVAEAAHEPYETALEWYDREARRRVNRRVMLTAEQVQERLDKIRAIPVAMPGADGTIGIQYIPIAKIPERLGDYTFRPESFRSKQQELFQLLRQTPPILRSGISMYLDAFRVLGATGDIDLFMKRLTAAEDEVTAVLKKQRLVAQYLNDIARRVVPAAARFAPYIPAVEDSASRARRLAPELHDYLDRIETGSLDRRVPGPAR